MSQSRRWARLPAGCGIALIPATASHLVVHVTVSVSLFYGTVGNVFLLQG